MYNFITIHCSSLFTALTVARAFKKKKILACTHLFDNNLIISLGLSASRRVYKKSEKYPELLKKFYPNCAPFAISV